MRVPFGREQEGGQGGGGGGRGGLSWAQRGELPMPDKSGTRAG